MQQSRETFRKYNTTPERAQNFGRTLTRDKVNSWSGRNRTVYHVYYNRSYPTYYGGGFGDPFGNPYFWMWLMDRPNYQAQWIYHHQAELDQRRLAALYAQNANLQAQVLALQRQGIAPNPNYAPPGLDPDLQYSQDYVQDSYQHAQEPVVSDNVSSGGGFPWGWIWFIAFIGLVVVVIFKMKF